MNKEQIARHGEVMGWFIQNPNKGVWVKLYTSLWSLVEDPCFMVDFLYVQNDEYTELRKAHDNGKQLQFMSLITDEWENTKGKCSGAQLLFNNPIENYRITPDKPIFKIGDWITDSHTIWQHKEDCKATNNTQLTWKLWEPQQDEWCVFWNDKHMHYTIGQYLQTLHNNNYNKQGDLSYYNKIAPLEFAMTLKDT